MFKKIQLFIFTIITFLSLSLNSNAASGNINVSSSSTAVVGSRVTVTVTLSSSTAIGSWEMNLNYDKTYLQLVSSTAEAGGTKMANSSSGTKSKSYTFTFKTLKKGTTRVSVSNYLVYAYDDLSEMSINNSNKNINIITQQELEDSYSKDNNLKSLTVEGYELDKAFDKNSLEYIVNVPTGTTSVKVNASVNDKTASLNGTGEIAVTEGSNTIPIVVTAQNGSTKTYTLIINVEDLNPINININNVNFVVVKNVTLLNPPEAFTPTTIKINDFDIPAFQNTAADITLVGLKDESGNISLYQYSNNEYLKYNQLNTKEYLLIPTNVETKLDLIPSKIEIDGYTYDAYKYTNDSKLYVISAKSLEDGSTSLYTYDPTNQALIKYDDSYILETNNLINNYTYLIYVLIGTSAFLIFIIFILIHNLRKKQKKINKFVEKQEAKIEATRKLNDVVAEVQKITGETKNNNSSNNKKAKNKPEVKVEEVTIPDNNKNKNDNKTDNKKKEEPKTPDNNPTEEVYNLFEDDKKSKKKKK